MDKHIIHTLTTHTDTHYTHSFNKYCSRTVTATFFNGTSIFLNGFFNETSISQPTATVYSLKCVSCVCKWLGCSWYTCSFQWENLEWDCYLDVCMFMCVWYMYIFVWMCVGGGQMLASLSQLLSALFFETGSVSHWLPRLAGQWVPGTCLSPTSTALV